MTLLTPTSDAPPFSPFEAAATPSGIESDENRLECEKVTVCIGGERDSADGLVRSASLDSDEYRPKGSGDKGIIGELPLRGGPGGECGPFFSLNARVQMADSEETTSCGLATVGLEARVDTPLTAR